MNGDQVFLPIGPVVVTDFAGRALAEAGEALEELLHRHQRGDWGEVNQQGKLWNERALEAGAEVASYYRLSTGVIVQVVTDSDHGYTIVQLLTGN